MTSEQVEVEELVTLETPSTSSAPNSREEELDSLRDFFENAAIGMHWVDADGMILRVNRTELELLGYDESEYIGHNIAEFHRDVDVLADILSRLAAGETLHNYEATMVARDGTPKHVLIDSSVRFKDGAFLHTRCLTREITGQRQAEEALSESDALNRSLIAAMPALVVTMDAAGTYEFCSESYLDYTGLTFDQASNWQEHQVIHPHDYDASMERWAQAMSSGEPLHSEMRLRRHDGVYRWFAVQGVAVMGPSGDIRRWITVSLDIDDRKTAEAELVAALEAREEAVAMHRAIEDQLTLLVEASSGLIESAQLRDMLPKILALSTGLIAADAYALWSVDREAGEWRVLSTQGLSEEYLRQHSLIPITDGAPVRTNEVLLIEDVDTEQMLAERRAGYAQEGIRSILVLPLRSGAQNTGTLTFYFREPHRFTDTEVRIGSALANLSSSAMALANLQEAQHRSRTRVEESNRKLAFLAEASLALSSSLDYEETLQTVAEMAVPEIADWCAVNLMDETGKAQPLALAHTDPDKIRFVQEAAQRYPPDPDAPHGWPEVLRTRKPELLTEISDELIEQSAVDEEHLQIIRALGLRSSLIVPLIARGSLLGAITFVTADMHAPLTQDDMPFAEELARRAAIAIDNAQLFREAERVARDLRQANAAKDEFLGLVSHELRTPITVILGNAYVLTTRGDQIDPTTQDEALHDIHSEAERLNRIIENLLVLARLERTASSQLEPVSLQHVIEQVIQTHRVQFPMRELRFAPPPSPIFVRSNEFCVEQVLRNFLSNAEKYSHTDELIEIDASATDDTGSVAVLDRGAGIPEDEIDRIFDPFYRVADTAHISGVGIGLTVCKRLVEAHGGSVRASARDGGGSVLSFSLPRTDPDQRES